MKNNVQLRGDVQHAIQWEPLLHNTKIDVSVLDGIVTLSGIVDSYAKKLEIENATKKLQGVNALVENIQVKFPSFLSRTNTEIAINSLTALKLNLSIPDNVVEVKVEDGWVTLDGELPWNYQKEAAQQAIAFLQGVKGISNNIIIKSDVQDVIEKKDVENALARSWSVDNREIQVFVSGTTVTLKGQVESWFQKDEAGRVAWNTPGIWHVKNELRVNYHFSLA